MIPRSLKFVKKRAAKAMVDTEKLFKDGKYREGLDRIEQLGLEIENHGWALIMAKQHFEKLGNAELLQLFVDAVEKFIYPPESRRPPKPRLYLVSSENNEEKCN